MIHPNKNINQEETLRRLQEEGHERLRINLFNAIQMKLNDFEMDWKDFAGMLAMHSISDEFLKIDEETGQFRGMTGEELKAELGDDPLTLEELNMIASCFSCDIQIIFKPRYPYTNT